MVSKKYLDIGEKQIKDKYPGRRLSIDVSEDGENGCHVEYPKEY